MHPPIGIGFLFSFDIDELKTDEFDFLQIHQPSTSNKKKQKCRIFERPFFQALSLFLHYYSFKIRCWIFDVHL